MVLKKVLLQILFLFLIVSVYGQMAAFKDYNFNKGGYYILGTFWGNQKSTLRDSLGEFFTNDIKILNQFKKSWVFKKPGHQYACGYHYIIYLCKNGQVLKSFYVNLNCEEIVSEENYFHFDPNKLRIFYGKLDKVYTKKHDFDSIDEARKYRNNILKDTNLIMCETPDWTKFEGEFVFEKRFDSISEQNIENEDKIIQSMDSEIRKKYPNEAFELSWTGGSLTEIIVRIRCNKSLEEKFDMYYRDYEYFGKWEAYSLALTTYWNRNNRVRHF